MISPAPSDLIFDWNRAHDDLPTRKSVHVVDETLYEADHAPSCGPLDEGGMAELIDAMRALGVHEVDLGALTETSAPRITRLARICERPSSPMEMRCVISSDDDGLALAARLADQVGSGIRFALVVHASELHQRAAGLSPQAAHSALRRTLEKAVRHGLTTRLLLHDAARARPAGLRRLVEAAVDAGVTHFCLWDCAGQSSPSGVRRLLAFVRGILAEHPGAHHLGWFGRNDRDLALANALEAVFHGADTLHAAALGVGHGAGNIPLDLLLANLLLLDVIEADLTTLKRYCDIAARTCGIVIPVNYPIVGRDAFRTATGVHAAAIIKARDKGDHWLADRVYSSMPAGLFGLRQIIDVGPMSGESNVVAWLEQHQITPHMGLVRAILARAKASMRTLAPQDMFEEVRAFRETAGTSC